MKKNNDFEVFLKSGKISDYLNYRKKVKEYNGEKCGITGRNNCKDN